MLKRRSNLLKRYTTLSGALQALENRNLVLLDPKKWDDSNDAHFLELYRKSCNSKSVTALCCTMAAETYHHWRIFTAGIEGVCIEFSREALESAIANTPDLVFGAVDYKTTKNLKDLPSLAPEKLPFLKRYGFRDEREWRVVHNDKINECDVSKIEFEISSVKRIILNPWLPESLSHTVKKHLRAACGGESIKITRSLLTNSRDWKADGERLSKST